MFICKLEARGIGSGGQEDNGQLRVNVCVCVCVCEREREREREKGQRIMLLVLLCGWTRGNTSCARLDQNLIRNLVSQFFGKTDSSACIDVWNTKKTKRNETATDWNKQKRPLKGSRDETRDQIKNQQMNECFFIGNKQTTANVQNHWTKTVER